MEVGSDVGSEKSGTGGWKQEVSLALVEIQELLKEKNSHLEKIVQSWETSKGDGDSTMKE